MTPAMRVGLASRRGAAWSVALRSHLADHTTGIGVSLILDPTELARAGFSVLFVDDQARSLTPGAVAVATAAGTFVIGLTDEANGRGRAHLEALGAQRILAISTPTAELAAILDEIGPRNVAGAPLTAPVAHRGRSRTATVSVWTKAGGGAGLTEALIGVADILGASRRTLVIEAAETPGVMAARLGRSPEISLVWALERAAQGHPGVIGGLATTLEGVALGRFDLIAQANAPGGPPPMSPDALVTLLSEALGVYDHVAIEIGALLGPAAGTGRDRSGAARAVAARADVLAVMASADPLGALGLITARASALDLAPGASTWGIFGRTPRSRFEQSHLAEVIAASTRRAAFDGLVFLAEDPAVSRARWNGEIARRGPWAKAVASLAAEIAEVVPRPLSSAPVLSNSLGVVMST